MSEEKQKRHPKTGHPDHHHDSDRHRDFTGSNFLHIVFPRKVGSLTTLTILGFLLFSICIYGQKPVYTGLNAEKRLSYKLTPEWKKHKKYQAWGWTTFGVGSAMVISGFMGYAIDNMEGPTTRYRFMILGFTGVAVTAASVPLFIFSVKNKKKAKTNGRASLLYLGNSALAIPSQNGSGMAYANGMSVGIYF